MAYKVLIVDDDRKYLSDFSEMMRNFDFEVWTAGNFEELEQILLTLIPDILIFDIILGSESGPDVYDRVMKSERMPKTPVIFVSNLVDPRSQSPFVKGRQVAMYSKPLEVEVLVRDIRTAFPNSIAA